MQMKSFKLSANRSLKVLKQKNTLVAAPYSTHFWNFWGRDKGKVFRVYVLSDLEDLRSAYSDAIPPSSSMNGRIMRYSSKLVPGGISLITTWEGYLGVTPHAVKEGENISWYMKSSSHDNQPLITKLGDIICLFLCYNFPMLFRPTTFGYLVVGLCFIHGLMDGEGLLGPLPNPWNAIMLRREWQYEYSLPSWILLPSYWRLRIHDYILCLRSRKNGIGNGFRMIQLFLERLGIRRRVK